MPLLLYSTDSTLTEECIQRGISCIKMGQKIIIGWILRKENFTGAEKWFHRNMNPSIYMFLNDFHIRGGARRVYHTLTWRWWLYPVQMLFPPNPNPLFYQDFKMYLHPCRHDWESQNHRINPLMNRIKFPRPFTHFIPGPSDVLSYTMSIHLLAFMLNTRA